MTEDNVAPRESCGLLWRPARRRAIVPTMTTPHDHSTNPLHGVTLERMLTELVAEYGWARMGRRVRILCFTSDPSIGSSLKFLRRTPWARTKVEAMYLDMKRRRTPTA